MEKLVKSNIESCHTMRIFSKNVKSNTTRIFFKNVQSFLSANANDARHVLHPGPQQVDLVPGHVRQLRDARDQERINSDDTINFLRNSERINIRLTLSRMNKSTDLGSKYGYRLSHT